MRNGRGNRTLLAFQQQLALRLGALLSEDADTDSDSHTQQWRALKHDTPGIHPSQISVLLDEMAESKRPGTSTDSVRRTLEFIAASYRSALTGQTVHAGDIGRGDPFYTQLNGDRSR